MRRTPIVVALLVLTVVVSVPVRATDNANKAKRDPDRERMVQIKQGELDDLRAENAALKELVRKEMVKRMPRNAATGEVYGQDRLEQLLASDLAAAKAEAQSAGGK
ncbi:MAG TPA: hypothetical protein VGI81_29495 [Tepidisphaeraceae bacterium]|jgi:hypothetical protein